MENDQPLGSQTPSVFENLLKNIVSNSADQSRRKSLLDIDDVDDISDFYKASIRGFKNYTFNRINKKCTELELNYMVNTLKELRGIKSSSNLKPVTANSLKEKWLENYKKSLMNRIKSTDEEIAKCKQDILNNKSVLDNQISQYNECKTFLANNSI